MEVEDGDYIEEEWEYSPAAICGACVCSAVCGFALLALGIAAQFERSRFDPVYEEVVCFPGSVEIASLQFNPTKVVLDVPVDCTNHNPYSLLISPVEGGQAFLNNGEDVVGDVIVRDKVELLEADGDTPSRGAFVLRASVDEVVAAAGAALSGTFTVYFELRIGVKVEPLLFGLVAPAKLDTLVEEDCGMQVRLLPQQEVGDAVCGPNFTSLLIPPIGDQSEESEGFRATVSEETQQDVAKVRDLILHCTTAVACLLGLCCAGIPIGALLRRLRERHLERKVAEANRGPAVVGFAQGA